MGVVSNVLIDTRYHFQNGMYAMAGSQKPLPRGNRVRPFDIP